MYIASTTILYYTELYADVKVCEMKMTPVASIICEVCWELYYIISGI